MSVCSRYHDESLRPPPERWNGEEEEEEDSDSDSVEEALIDFVAYMFHEHNHTSARCPFATSAGKVEELQVTFCLSPPPRISYFCISYTSGEPTRFISEPLMLATEGNLALISVKQGPTWLPRSTDYTYLIYRAAAPATLTVLPLPSADLFPEEHCYLTQGEVGILVYTRKPHQNKAEEELYYDSYKIAALYAREDDVSGTKHYDLHIYDASTDAWTREHTVFPQEPPPPSFCSDRVITVGGTMFWVDLSQGMILCQVHLPEEEQSTGLKQLRYIRLPKPLQPRDHLPLCVSTSSFSRDINIVDGCISFVDIEIQASPGSLIPDCWTAVIWTMAVNDSEFHKVREVKSADIASHAALDPQTFFVAHPTLSSHSGDILYLMAKSSLDPLDPKSSVLAVNTRRRKMERVAKYTTQRGGSMDFAYMLTTISKYLAPPGGYLAYSNAMLKKRAPAFLGSSRRKASAFTLSRYGGDQVDEEEDYSKNPFSMNDNMDLE